MSDHLLSHSNSFGFEMEIDTAGCRAYNRNYIVGGEITSYTEMLNEARQIAVKRMVDEAEAMEADAVINVRYGSSSVMQGAAEVIAYGTAVKYR